MGSAWLSSPVLIDHSKTSERTEVSHRASRDLMGWDVWWLRILDLFHRAGLCLNRFHQLHRPCLHHHVPYISNFNVFSDAALLTFSARSHVTKSTGTTPRRSPSNSGTTEASRVYGFDLNENWQGDREHNDNQKVNGLTFPRRVIRSSAFTQKLAKAVILLLYQWQPCSTNKPTIIGFENWPMRGSCISSYGRYGGRGVCDGITLSWAI